MHEEASARSELTLRMRNSCAFNVSALASYDRGRTGDIAYIFYAKASIGVIVTKKAIRTVAPGR